MFRFRFARLSNVAWYVTLTFVAVYCLIQLQVEKGSSQKSLPPDEAGQTRFYHPGASSEATVRLAGRTSGFPDRPVENQPLQSKSKPSGDKSTLNIQDVMHTKVRSSVYEQHPIGLRVEFSKIEVFLVR